MSFEDFTMEEKVQVLSTILGKTVLWVYLHPVTFKLIYTDICLGDIEEALEEVSDEMTLFPKSLLEEIGEKGWDMVPIKGLYHIKVQGTGTGNSDSRGGGCGDLKIPVEEFQWEIKHEDKEITLRDFTECVYRMKGSKYDWWYELFSGISLVDHHDKFLEFETDFGYGS
jgi:hypothetical protein